VQVRYTLLLALGSISAAPLPSTVTACLSQAGPGYIVMQKVDPPILSGDFDGDGKPDIAVVVMHKSAQGVVVCRSSGSPIVLGAGRPFNEMINLDFASWRLHPKSVKVPRGAGMGTPPILKGDALLLEWESASAVVYWDGARFVWYQQGD